MSNTNNINSSRCILDFQQMDSHQSLIDHLGILLERYPYMNVIPLAMYDGRMVPAIILGHGSRMTLYTADTSDGSFLPAQLLMRYINEYCEIRRTGRRVFSIDLPSLEASRSICVIPLAQLPDGSAVDLPSDESRLSIELRRGVGRVCCNTASCSGHYRGVAQSVCRLCGYRMISSVSDEPQTAAAPHFEVYTGLDSVSGELDFFRCYTSIRELLFVAPIIA